MMSDSTYAVNESGNRGKDPLQNFVKSLNRRGSLDQCETQDKSSSFSYDKSTDVTNISEFNYLKAKTRLVMVGVADTGTGLRKSVLDRAEAGLSNSDSHSMVSGAKNSGFGLHLAHQLAKALGSRVHMASLKQCKNLLNQDTLNAMMESQRSRDHSSIEVKKNDNEDVTSSKVEDCETTSSSITPGIGTVLFITLPVFVDSAGAQKILKKTTEQKSVQVKQNYDSTLNEVRSRYVFCPRPAADSIRGSFRVLVADDVLMLRKGLVHAMVDVFSVFPDCPLHVYTACSAEDALRAVASQPFDLVICDNQFAEPTDLALLSPNEEERRDRPHSFFQANTAASVPKRKIISNFFAKERFTIKEGDGYMSGLNALMRIEKSSHVLPSVTPVLILLSGHKIQIPSDCGIIVIQKPLMKSEFVPILEAHVSHLLKLQQCYEIQNVDANNKSETIIKNKFGCQMFIKELLVAQAETK
mmetsp:Transcript_41396/g.48279  ORF Transcript_41396/g.48279 Transcript_41396/m.48279 type:complete len:470 (+) Transcript_41396:1242-2651(+)|eukprot:CAMPEP_0194450734 /NCGR_PEP_ID=MMETSP0176-20130528/130900_1 /TAXON_ID=216777 /ORGANISM="Proboscia alata, Strain PI-D3" /LENGTH=469 /DNA_ID=CAMNT_0039278073 /DNA_START=421 /DNA_END=1830 /DNA_ORIENTATION=+